MDHETLAAMLGASAARQFDALIHMDLKRAVEPLERSGGWELGEPPETHPTAL